MIYAFTWNIWNMEFAIDKRKKEQHKRQIICEQLVIKCIQCQIKCISNLHPLFSYFPQDWLMDQQISPSAALVTCVGTRYYWLSDYVPMLSGLEQMVCEHSTLLSNPDGGNSLWNVRTMMSHDTWHMTHVNAIMSSLFLPYSNLNPYQTFLVHCTFFLQVSGR